MGTRISKLAVLVMLCTVGIGSSTRVLAQPEQDGQWGSILSWPLEAIHMIVLKNGKVLAFDFPACGNCTTRCILFDPDPGINDPVIQEFAGPASPFYRLVSSGHTALADGKIFFTGGEQTVETTTLYDPHVDGLVDPTRGWYNACEIEVPECNSIFLSI